MSLARTKWGRLAIAFAAILLLRLAIPTSPTGYWRGPFFDCLCSSDVTGEFSHGRVLIHQDPWDPTLISPKLISTDDGGRYRRCGWHTFEWEQPKTRGGTLTNLVYPGWMFSRYIDAQTGEVSWTVREFNFHRLWKIRESKVR